jgi:FtsH-binding integral membrane protein
MPRTIIRARARVTREPTRKEELDDFFSKLAKYIPVEINGAFVALYGIIDGITDFLIQDHWIIFIALAILSPLYLWYPALRENQPPDKAQIFISPFAFMIWVSAIGGPFTAVPGYRQDYAAIFLIFATLVIPMCDYIITEQKDAWKVILGLCVVISAVFVGKFFLFDPKITISNPENGSIVGFEEIIQGTSVRIPQDSDIWIIIYNQTASLYYPNSNPVQAEIQGNWQLLTEEIGIPNDSGSRFIIIATLVNSEGRVDLNAYVVNSQREGEWLGMDSLPDGVLPYDQVTVIRE